LEIAMTERSVTHSTLVLERHLNAPPTRVYEAFADPDLKRRWFAEGDQHEVEEFTASLEPGAVERLRYRFREGTAFAGAVISNADTVLDVVPGQRIIWNSSMRFGDHRISLALVTAEFLAADDGGTDLILTFQGAFLPGADGPVIREQGWRDLLDRLAAVLTTDP
jgi:uncharacterized protein YndB with AHSA1/START domain